MQPLEGRCVGVVEDDPIMGEALADGLGLEGANVVWWESGEEAATAIETGALPDAIICDICLPDVCGETLFPRLRGGPRAVPVLFMTAFGDIDQAVRLMRAGAADYVTKPFTMDDLLRRLAALMPAEVPETPLGVSPEIRRIETTMRRIVGHAAPILFTGETGVGKEVCARRFHELARPRAPFVAVNCAAIPADLLESELFGYERGAFTGAHARHLGYAERARDGILFLDEIGEMPPALQVKLLHLVEARGFHRLGGEATIPFRARIVAATNRDLHAAVRDGTFREDLLYRLDTFAIAIPPLRERPDDVAWLMEGLAARMIADVGGAVRGLSVLAVEAARAHRWPGNARELRNRVERAVALADGPLLMPSDLFPPARGDGSTPSGPLAEVRDAAERRAIAGAIRDVDGELAAAARLLGISRTTLWEKMKRLGPFC